jgi:UbiD family decarboxylase
MSMDLHSFLAQHKGEYLEINKPVKLDHVGALVAEHNDTIVFNQLEGYPGYRLVDLLFCNRRAQARVLGCDPKQVVPALAQVIKSGPKPLKVVEGGPCQERVFTGDDVDLCALPIPRHTAQDAWPYCTSFAIHRDPDTGMFNQMFPRHGRLNRKEMVSSFVTPTANAILAKHAARGTPMPQAIVIGAHPAWELAGCYSHTHDGWWEGQLFESITGQVGEVTRCKTVDLVVPADASIVIEGYLNPQRMGQDGPNPGPTMLFCPYTMQKPIFEVTAITMRRDPIYRHHQCTPFTDHQEMPRIFHEAVLYERLRAMGLKVHDVHFPQGGGALSVIIQVEPTYDGQITDALLAVLGSPWMNTKMAIAVDPDINIYDYRDVHYAMATRVNPSRDVTIIHNARAFPMDPSGIVVKGTFPDSEDTRFPSLVGKIGIDATKPAPFRVNERKVFERAWPVDWGKVKLADYLS